MGQLRGATVIVSVFFASFCFAANTFPFARSYNSGPSVHNRFITFMPPNNVPKT